MKVRLAPLALMVLVNWPSTVMAEARDDAGARARALALEGAREFNAGEYQQARQHFAEALDLAPIPSVAVSTAQTQVQLGKWVEASALYERALAMTPNEHWVGSLQQQWQREAEQALAALKPRIPSLTLEVGGELATASTVITIDGNIVPHEQLTFALNPGSHVVVARQGARSAEASLTLIEAEKRTLALHFAETALQANQQPLRPALAPASPANPTDATHDTSRAGFQRTLGWVGIGVGATSLAVGVTSGILVGLKRASLHDAGCSGDACVGPEYRDRLNTYNDLRTVSTVSLVIGGVATAGGITLLLMAADSNGTPAVNLAVSPGQVSLVADY